MLVYVGTESGGFMALDASTGDIVWSVDFGTSILSTPPVQGGSVWVSRANSPVLYKLNAAAGAIQCSLPLAGSQDGSLTNAFLARSDPDDSVYALNAVTGAKVWSFTTPSLAGDGDTDVGAGLTISPPGRNGFNDGVAYVPAEDGWLFALDLVTGRLVWSYDFGAELPLDHRSRSTAALVGRRLIFGEHRGVMAVNAVTGQPDWTFATGDVESMSAPAVVGPAGQQVVAVTTLAGRSMF